MPSRLLHDPGTALAEARLRLASHRLYGLVRTSAALRTFMEHHVVCVLDFMSLLKSLQRDLTCIDVPWTPTADPEAARLIHSIVHDEESDVRADGRVQSHFAWYVEAMEEIGADVEPVRALVDELARARPLAEALRSSRLPTAARAFGLSTAAFLSRGVHVRAAVFFHGREEVIPEMYAPIVEELAERGLACETFRAYLARHVEIDGGSHGPLAEGLLRRLYGGDEALRVEAELAALESLAARDRLWDAIAEACD
jgi:hypothetical protein